MSWTQGIQTREDLPEKFLNYVDGLGKGHIKYITWFEPHRDVLFLDYGEQGGLKLTIKEKSK